MQQKREVVKLPSGRTIVRSFNDAGELASEIHHYVDPHCRRAAILIAMVF